MLRKTFGIYNNQSMCLESILSDADHITDLTAVEAVLLAGQKKHHSTLAQEYTCAVNRRVTAHM